MSLNLFDRGVNLAVSIATLNKAGVKRTEEFEKIDKSSNGREKSLMEKVFDSTTLFIIDDEHHEIVPRFELVKK